MDKFSIIRITVAVVLFKAAMLFAGAALGQELPDYPEPEPPIVDCDTDADCEEKNGGQR